MMTNKSLKPLKTAISITLVATLAVACSPVIRNHGYAPVEEDLSLIQVGSDTRGSVRRKIGRPGSSGIFTNEGWYYVSTQIEHMTYNEPRVIDRTVVAVLFDGNDVVSSVNRYGLDDGRIIDLETQTTPTYGRRLTVLEQAFGNIGVLADDIFDQ